MVFSAQRSRDSLAQLVEVSGGEGAIDKIDPHASHASWMETFPWTRVAGVAVPQEHKAAVELPDRDEISYKRFREVVGDGSFGGWYERTDEEMKTIQSDSYR